VPAEVTTVTLLNGEIGHWSISRNLGSLYRPVNKQADDQEAVNLLQGDPELQDRLISMIWPEVNDLASIARKDARFGVLFERRFNCAEAALQTGHHVAPRMRVEQRILADIASELRRNPKLEMVDLAIADPEHVKNSMVGLWAFVPVDVMHANDWDFHFLDDVIALLVE
jgi:hypothetical protein